MKEPQGFDFPAYIGRVIADISSRCPPLSHIQEEHLLISFSYARVKGLHGQFAKIWPMCFEGGEKEACWRGKRYRLPTLTREGKEILYILYFCMPKFLNLTFNDKLLTIFHELYHISPDFNGDIRRLPGRNYAHGKSLKEYNKRCWELAQFYLSQSPPAELLYPLQLNYKQLCLQYGKVFGLRIRQPKPELVR